MLLLTWFNSNAAAATGHFAAAGSTITMVTAGSGNQTLVFHLDLSCKLFLMASDNHVFCRSINLNVIFREHHVYFFLILTLNVQEWLGFGFFNHFFFFLKKGSYLLLPSVKVVPFSDFFMCLLWYFHTFSTQNHSPEEHLASEASRRLI